MSKLLLVVHNLKTGQDIVHEFCETDFAYALLEDYNHLLWYLN